MLTRTVTSVLDRPADEVFDYLSRVESLPEWATEFARELRIEDGQATVVNGLGEFLVRIDADPGTGVVDIYAGPNAEAMARFPSRVVALGTSTCAYTFTMFQQPDMPADLFLAQHASLEREFANIRARFGDGAT
jgi:hypothetical protein